MAYRPKTVQSGFKRGDSGIAKVQLSADKKKVRITFEDTEKVVITEDFPKGMMAGKWFVSLDSENKKVFGYRPINGLFIGKVQKFIAKEGEEPVPQTFVGKDYSYQYFSVLLEITKGDCKGLTVPARLRYHFSETEEDEKKVVAYSHPKSKYTPQLVEFCEVAGVWERGIMPYKDNVLPMMQKRILAAGKEFQFVMKNGYVNDFMPADLPLSEDIPDEEAE